MSPASDPYELLGVARDATAEEIKAAYRKAALRDHPDRNPGDREAEERFKAISEAYATLRDPDKRAWVDRGGPAAGGPRPDFSTVDWQTIFAEADVRVDFGQGVPRTGNAVFDALFGAMTGMLRQQGVLPGEDRAVTLAIDLTTAREGGAARVRVPGPSVCAACRGTRLGDDGRPCTACGGRGVRQRGDVVEVRVPPGVRDGGKLRLRGLGGPGRPPGDALVTLSVRLPDGVRRVGDELHAELSVTPLEARSGVRTRLHGVPVTVPPGASDGTVVRVPGGGLAGADLRVTVRERVWRGLARWARDKMGGTPGGEP
jgi:DnaJ-class molecular chaperone